MQQFFRVCTLLVLGLILTSLPWLQSTVAQAPPDIVSEKPLSLSQMQKENATFKTKVAAAPIYYNGPRTIKKVALTFDDGPDNTYTSQILDVLKQYKVKSTFFVVGTMAANNKYQANLKRIVIDGHIIANHSWSHKDLAKVSTTTLNAELDKTNAIVYKYTKKKMKIFRPPYGSAKGITNQVASKGFITVNWDVDPNDWKKGITAAEIIRTVKSQTKNGSIILMHSAGGSRSETVKALPQIIKYLKSKGYTIVTVDQLLNKPAYAN
ncbi:Peptidoglycan/xylan/chitin deacetylase, PgdA/CDA1 family [Seinonella peptonophila]|uniref:Peptidoglycan/xylan/chitin deacetylase, PgdA/CDA1 family n=1 Tax=Seinonella peptonophila TaxID=112248 RepID=A0A1M4SU41_9BACL|nr:polysaccharide deacetylase family protein [Seinonella peptonophila]SHE35527.1 Peptidoglycan/xylan/chitin deacetylase, PgdA/CDA1 family [Seinonella peptonophila]